MYNVKIKMNLRLGIILVIIAVFSTACSDGGEDAASDKDIKELVHDYSVGNIEAEAASITSSELMVKDENQEETAYELPEDEFFVSIAPFVNETHECDIHSLTGCQGELVDTEFEVYIEDSAGEVIKDEEMKTEANGFIDLWLPRNETLTVTITQDGEESTSEITTFDGDKTCITDMQMT